MLMQNDDGSSSDEEFLGEWNYDCPFEFDDGQIHNIKSKHHIKYGIVFYANQRHAPENLLSQEIKFKTKTQKGYYEKEKILAQWQISNQFYIVIYGGQGNFRFYRSQQDDIPKLMINIYQGPYFDNVQSTIDEEFYAFLQYRRGFFVNHSEYIRLISNQTLRQLYGFKKSGFEDIDQIQLLNGTFNNIVAMDHFLLFEIVNGMITIMAQFNGRMIRKIQGFITDYGDYSNCSTSSEYTKLDIYDIMKGRYVAKAQFISYDFEPAYVKGNHLIVYDKRYKIKKQYLKK